MAALLLAASAWVAHTELAAARHRNQPIPARLLASPACTAFGPVSGNNLVYCNITSSGASNLLPGPGAGSHYKLRAVYVTNSGTAQVHYALRDTTPGPGLQIQRGFPPVGPVEHIGYGDEGLNEPAGDSLQIIVDSGGTTQFDVTVLYDLKTP
jgi:hypothetical protein